MTAGSMRDRMRFEVRAVTGDEFGNPTTGDFVAQFTRAVEIKPLIGSEEVMASRLGGTQPAVIIARFDSQTSRITPEWRAVDVRTGTVYDIRTAIDRTRQREFIEMMAVAGVAA